MKKSTLTELKNLTRNAKKRRDVFSSINDLPLSLLLTMRIQGRFWEMLDKDFKKKIDNESIHEIFSLVFRELNEEQLINILNQIEPDGLLNIHQQIKERKDEKEALAYLEDVEVSYSMAPLSQRVYRAPEICSRGCLVIFLILNPPS